MGTEHEAHLPGIYYSFVLVAVVEQDMHLAGLFGDLSDLIGPGLDLFFGVKIIETFSRADAFLFPGLAVPAVEADQPNVGRYFGDRRHTRFEALRLVHADKWQVVAPEKIEGRGAILFAQPHVVSELHGQAVLP